MKKALISAVLIFFAVILIVFPEVSEEAVRSSMTTAIRSVIPSLFSFMVLSDVIVSSDIISEKSKLLTPFGKLFNVSKSGAAVFILGNLSGFPVGARLAARQCERGLITTEEAARLAVISNNVSTAFAVSFVGAGLFSSRALGVSLYLCQLAAAIITGIIIGLIPKRKKTHPTKLPKEDLTEKKASGIFVKAVNDGAISCLGICAFIVVFGVISSYIKEIFASFGLPPFFNAVISAFLEISNGCISVQSLSFPLSASLCAFAIGFSGISVLCQSSMFLKRAGISVMPIAAAKVFQGLLTAIFTSAVVRFFNISCEASVTLGEGTAVFSRCFAVSAAAILAVYLIFRVKSALQMRHST